MTLYSTLYAWSVEMEHTTEEHAVYWFWTSSTSLGLELDGLMDGCACMGKSQPGLPESWLSSMCKVLGSQDKACWQTWVMWASRMAGNLQQWNVKRSLVWYPDQCTMGKLNPFLCSFYLHQSFLSPQLLIPPCIFLEGSICRAVTNHTCSRCSPDATLVCRFILFHQLQMRTLWHHHHLQTIYPLGMSQSLQICKAVSLLKLMHWKMWQ